MALSVVGQRKPGRDRSARLFARTMIRSGVSHQLIDAAFTAQFRTKMCLNKSLCAATNIEDSESTYEDETSDHYSPSG
jgi:hypothetical protein